MNRGRGEQKGVRIVLIFEVVYLRTVSQQFYHRLQASLITDSCPITVLRRNYHKITSRIFFLSHFNNLGTLNYNYTNTSKRVTNIRYNYD